ncbi:MAG: hypothetical protein OHM56_00075 [Spiroplasma phoeniceum]|nr:MAG: hypothetical protein OHM57_12585 [Spiroplasma phoeniceum]UZQ32433.1 MAG: hypothetical protein OHM56_00075 [Spiroplasma phoeniceum]
MLNLHLQFTDVKKWNKWYSIRKEKYIIDFLRYLVLLLKYYYKI